MVNYYNHIIKQLEKDDLGRGYLYWYCNSIIRQNFFKLNLSCSDSDIDDLVYRYVSRIVDLLEGTVVQLLDFDNNVHEFTIMNNQDSLGVLNAIFEEAFKNGTTGIDYEEILLRSDKRFLVLNGKVYGNIPQDISKYIWEKHRHEKYAGFVKNLVENPNGTNVFCRRIEECPGALVEVLKDFMLYYDKYLIKAGILDDDIHKIYGIAPSSNLYPIMCSFSKVIGDLGEYKKRIDRISNDAIMMSLNDKLDQASRRKMPVINIKELKYQVAIKGLGVKDAYDYCVDISKRYSIKEKITNATFLKILQEIVDDYND